MDAAKTLIRSGEIKIISVCVAHYQDAVERGLLKKNSVGPGYPASHTFQRQPGKSLNLMGENADINLSDMKLAVSVMQAPASPVSESLDDTGTCQVNEALDLEISCTVLVNLIRYIELHSLCLCYVLTCCVCFRRNRLVTFFYFNLCFILSSRTCRCRACVSVSPSLGLLRLQRQRLQSAHPRRPLQEHDEEHPRAHGLRVGVHGALL